MRVAHVVCPDGMYGAERWILMLGRHLSRRGVELVLVTIGDSEGADRDTLVLWTQTPTSGLYVDLRLPKGSPGRSLSLARVGGFVPTPSALEARGFSVADPSKLLSSEQIDDLLLHKSFVGNILF